MNPKSRLRWTFGRLRRPVYMLKALAGKTGPHSLFRRYVLDGGWQKQSFPKPRMCETGWHCTSVRGIRMWATPGLDRDVYLVKVRGNFVMETDFDRKGSFENLAFVRKIPKRTIDRMRQLRSSVWWEEDRANLSAAEAKRMLGLPQHAVLIMDEEMLRLPSIAEKRKSR